MDLLAGGNLLVLCPVIAVVVGVVLVFQFGFKRPDELKFKKSSVPGSDTNKKPKKKDNKKPLANGVVAKSSNDTTKKERSTEPVVKKSPTKEVKPKKGAVPENTVQKDSKSKVKTTKKDQVKSGKVVEVKPDDFDDAGWFTVPTKSEKKKSKTEDVTNSPKPVKIEKSIVDKKNVKNAKQLKDQANKSKKEAEDAAATKDLKSVENIIETPPVIVEPEPVPKTISTVLEDDEQTKIIDWIQEAISEVVIEPVAVQKEIVSKSISKKIVSDREEKVDDIKPVESNMAFDELADAWTDAKPTKKNKKKIRKD